MIPDNLKAIVTGADPLAPRLNEAFVEYAPAGGFHVDPARVRRLQDKPRAERSVQVVRNSMWAGEAFVDLAASSATPSSGAVSAPGSGCTARPQCPPVELFGLEEAPLLLPVPMARYDLPIYTTAKVHRDHHIKVAKALYSVPGHLIDQRVDVRADSQLVRIYARGQLVKTHPRQQPGRRVTTPRVCPMARRLRVARHRPPPPATVLGSATTPPRCWAFSSRGRGCVKSMPCSGW